LELPNIFELIPSQLYVKMLPMFDWLQLCQEEFYLYIKLYLIRKSIINHKDVPG
jgi:hypothetical protein